MEITELIMDEFRSMERMKENWRQGLLTGAETAQELQKSERKIIAFVKAYREILEP